MKVVRFLMISLSLLSHASGTICPGSQKPRWIYKPDGNSIMKCYDPTRYIICPDGQEKYVGYGNPGQFACDECGFYSKKEQFCCGDFLYNKTKELSSCCGGKLWDRSIHLCCKGKLTNKKYPGDLNVYEKCCGSETFDSYTQKCCYDNEVYNPDTHYCAWNGMVVGFHQKVCRRKVYDPAYNTCCNGNLYKKNNPSDQNLCCGDKELYTEVADGFQCCGTDLYHGSRDLCCGNEVHSLAASSSTCCGTDSIARNDTNSICCGDKKYEAIHGQHTGCCVRQDDYNEPSFVGIYNTREKTCCRGELIDQQDPTKFCCDGGVASRQDLSQTRCCNTRSDMQMYDPNEYVCHENLVVHKDMMCGNDLRYENFSPDGSQLQCCGSQSMDPQKYECVMDSIVPKHCPRFNVTEQKVLNEICTFVNGTVIYATVKKQDDEFIRVRRRYSYSSEHIRKRRLQLGVNAACNSDIFAEGSKLIVLTSSKYDKKNNNLKLERQDIVLTWSRNYSKILRRKIKTSRTFCSLT